MGGGTQMSTLGSAKLLKNSGHFAAALEELDASAVERRSRQEARVLRAELLEAVGRRSEAEMLTAALLAAPLVAPAELLEAVGRRSEAEMLTAALLADEKLPAHHRSTCESTLGR